MFDKQWLAELERELQTIVDADDSLSFVELAELAQLDLRTDLQGANLERAELRGIDLRGADLRETDLSGADLTEALLSDANLEAASLRNAQLAGAVLDRAKLVGADLTEADLTKASLRDANLERANFMKVSLADSDLTGVQFKGAVFAEPISGDLIIGDPSAITVVAEPVVPEIPVKRILPDNYLKRKLERLATGAYPRLVVIEGKTTTSALVLDYIGNLLASASTGDSDVREKLSASPRPPSEVMEAKAHGRELGKILAEKIRPRAVNRITLDVRTFENNIITQAVVRGLNAGDVKVTFRRHTSPVSGVDPTIDIWSENSSGPNLDKGLNKGLLE